MAEEGSMRKFIYIAFLLSLYHGTVFCDEDCDNKMKGKVENYANRVSSSDLKVCSEMSHVKCGEDYAPALLEKRPTIYFDVGKSCEMVTIIFFGIYSDSTNLMWLVYNIPAEDLKKGFHGQSGNERIIYKMPKDSASETDHFFFVYCQGSEIENFDCCSVEERENVNVKVLANRNNLDPVMAAHHFKVTARDQLMEENPTESDEVCGTDKNDDK